MKTYNGQVDTVRCEEYERMAKENNEQTNSEVAATAQY
jgi:hypothetical protein